MLCAFAAGPAAAAAPRTPEQAVLGLLNEVRAQHRLPLLRGTTCLVRAARLHSREMLVGRYFAHDSLRTDQSWSTRVRRFCPRRIIGETIAWGTGGHGTPAGVVRAWMQSPPHRQIILDRHFLAVGVGRSSGTFAGYRAAAVFTADFATAR